jgi:hypothetical protein
MDYSDLLPAIFAAVVTLVAVFLAYLFQLRTLARQQAFERKRAAYEAAVTSLRRIKSCAENGVSLLRTESALDKLFEKVVQTDPSVDEKKARLVKEQLLGLIHQALLAIGSPRSVAKGIEKPHDLDPEMSGLWQTAGIGIELLRAAFRANEEFEDALVSLKLAGDKLGFASQLARIRDRIVAHATLAAAATDGKDAADWSWFDTDVQLVLASMQDDLSRTISPIKRAKTPLP